MSRPAKDETGRFMQAIAAFSAAPEPVTALGRALSPCDGGPVRAILREMNETVLRRKLVFCNASGSSLSMVVAERRLLSIAELTSDLMPDFRSLLDRIPSTEDADVVLALLAAFCVGGGPLYVVSCLTDSSGAEYEGLPVRHLSDQADAANAMQIPPAIAHALAASASMSRAAVHFENGARLGQQGEAGLCATLDTWLQARIATDPAPGSVTLWQGADVQGPARLHIRLAQVDIAMICDASRMVACFDLWRRVVASSESR